MKNTFILGILAAAMMFSCNDGKEQEIRYTQNSPEIDSFKAVIASYENADWEKYRQHFADTAALYYNSTESVSADEAISSHKETTAPLSSYGFVDSEGEYEMVVTDEGHTWVNFWGLWEGTIAENDSTIQIPVHITARYGEDGKVVTEYLYFDNSIMMNAMAALEAAAETEAESEDGSE